MNHPELDGTISLANGQELNCLRPVGETREERGAPTNPLRPIIVPTPTTPPSQPSPNPSTKTGK